MSQVEELLNSVAEVPAHTHPVPDTDTYFIIDPITRRIENTTRKKNVIMQYDHNSERFTFELPRYIDGHDMLECTSVTVNVDNIEAVETDGIEVAEARVNSDAPDMTDLRAHPDDPEKVISSWLISRNSTQFAGILSFHIEYKCVDPNGNVVYEWGTDTYDEIEIKARKKNGEAVVTEYTDLLEQWRAQIFGAGDSVMADISAEGKAQVAAVKAESETQQEAVELKGAQTLETIPEDYAEVNVMATEAVRSKGDAIVCEASGESIVLKDSSNDYIRGLKLFGKSTQKTTTGKNLVDNANTEFGKFRALDVNLPAGVYTISARVVSTDTDSDTSLAEIMMVDGTKTYARLTRNARANSTFSAMQDVVKITIYPGYDYATSEGDTATWYDLQIESGSVATEYEPYTGGKPSPSPEYPQELISIANPTVNVYSKNLIPYPYINSSIVSNGITFTANSDGSITANGTATGTAYFPLQSIASYSDVTPIPRGEYVLSGAPTEYCRVAIGIWKNEKRAVTYSAYTKQPYKITIDEDDIRFDIVCTVDTGVTLDNVVFKPQLEVGSTPTSYEPYVEPKTNTINHTLHGIPVTSGGNYTDSDGQQWICDEIDLERGVYVQRVKTVTLDGSSNEGWMLYDNNPSQGMSFVYYPYDGVMYFQSSMCDKYRNVNGCWGEPYKGQLSIYSDHNTVSGRYFRPPNESVDSLETWLAWLAENPLKLTYILAAPIETPLTAEEITAFKALRTNHPTTTILNDAGAWMSVKYNADTKTYVDNPKVLKLVDSSTGVVYELKVVDGSLTVVPIQ